MKFAVFSVGVVVVVEWFFLFVCFVGAVVVVVGEENTSPYPGLQIGHLMQG